MGANQRFIGRAGVLARRMRAEVGEEIRRARVAAGLSQTAAGAAVGMSRSKVGRIERGVQDSVALEDLIRLAGAPARAEAADGGVDFLILLLADTRANRQFVRERRISIAAMFPVPARAALDALEHARSPGGNSCVLL
jgi:transcriptional regulator with XRE-family HTH domain